MKRKLCSILALAFVISLTSVLSSAQDQKPVTPEEAAKFFGQSKTVCGKVIGPKFADKSKGQPTFLNLNQLYPNHIFTIVIWGEDRGKFSKPPEVLYDGQNVCVSGLIVEHKGKPQIVVRNPAQITVK
jgi:hypothetical protein